MIKNSLVNIAGSVVPLAIALITVPLYLPLIGEERYGILAVIWVLLGYFGIFDFGLGRATARQMSKIDNDKDRSSLFATVLLLIAILSVVGGGVLLLCSGWVITHLFSLSEKGNVEAIGSILWLPVGLLFLLLNSAMQGALQARERFVAINSAAVLGDSMAQTLPLCMAWMGWVTIDVLLPSVLAARFLTSIFLFIQCKKYVPLERNPEIDFSQVKPLLNYGGWASAITMIGPLLTVIDRLVIASIAGAKGVTYFTIPFNLVTKLSILPNSFGSVLFPRMAVLNTEDARVLAGNATRIITASMTPVVVIAIAMLHPFLSMWLGDELARRCAGIGEIMCIGVWIGAVVTPYSYFLYAEATQKRLILIASLMGVPIYALLLWAGVKYFGVVGAAAAWSLKSLLDSIVHLYLAKSLTETFRFALPSMFLLAAALLFGLNSELDVVWRLTLIVVLTVFSAAAHSMHWIDIYRLVTDRKPHSDLNPINRRNT